MSQREPPSDLAAERSVLGAPLLVPGIFRQHLAGALEPGDFFVPAHRAIFEAFAALDERDVPIDHITVADELKVRGDLPRLDGGETYLVDLAAKVPSAENVAHYVEIVREKASRRRIITLCSDVQSQAFGDVDGGSSALIEELMADAGRIANRKATGIEELGVYMGPMLEEIERRMNAPADQKITGIRFGVDPLDEVLGGLNPTEQCFIAGDVGSGKTALAVQAMVHNVLEDGGTGICISLEMSNQQIAERVAVHRAEVNSFLVRRGAITQAEYRKLFDQGRALQGKPIHVVRDAVSMPQITQSIRRWRARNPGVRKAVALIDFLQLIKFEMGRGAKRAEAVGAGAYGIKQLCKELDIASITISQLNREGQKAKSKDGKKAPPTKHDLKESGDIEASADQIVLVFNENDTAEGEVDLIVDKNRNGMKRTVRAQWTARFYKFSNPYGYRPITDWREAYDA